MAFTVEAYYQQENNQGVTDKIEIQEDGGSGRNLELGADGSRNGFRWRLSPITSESTDGLINPLANKIQVGKLTFFPRIETDAEQTLLDDILGSPDTTFRLVWKQKPSGGSFSTFWTGNIDNRRRSRPETGASYFATIRANDFEILKSIDYTLDDTRQTLITTISDLLGNLSFGLKIRTATSWITEDTTDSTDFLSQVYHETKALREFARTGDETDQEIKVWDALIHAGDPALLFRQVNGEFTVEQLTEFDDPENVHETVYTSAGAVDTATATVDRTLDGYKGVDSGSLVVKDGSQNDRYPAIKRAEASFDHRSQVGSLTLPANIYIDSGDGSDSHSEAFISTGDQQIQLSANVIALHSTDEGSGYVDVKIRVGQYFFDGSKWTTTSSDRKRVNLPSQQVTDGTSFIYKGSLIVNTPDIPADATTPIEIEFFEARIEASPDVIADDETSFQNISFEVVNPNDSNANSTAIKYELTQSDGYTTEFDLGSTWYGDGPTSAAPSALRHGSNDADITSNTWQRRGSTSYRNFHENLLKEVIDLQRGNTRKLDANFWGTYDPSKILVYDSQNFYCAGVTYHGHLGRWSANLFRINVQTGSDDFEEIPKFGGATSGDTSGGGGSSGGLDQDAGDNIWLNESNNLSDLDNAATARTNLGVEIGTDVQAWDTDLDTYAANPLTATELGELQNIGANTFPAASWENLSDIGGLAHSDGNFMVSDGTDWTVESGNTARTSLGLGTGDNVTFGQATLSNLTEDRVLIAGASGLVEDDSGLTFDGSVLGVGGSIHLTGTGSILQLNQDGSFPRSNELQLKNGTTEWWVRNVENNFSIRDHTNGNSSVFSIESGAPTKSFLITSDGDAEIKNSAFPALTIKDGSNNWGLKIATGATETGNFVVQYSTGVFAFGVRQDRSGFIDGGFSINTSSLEGFTGANINGTTNIKDTLTGVDADFSSTGEFGGLLTAEAGIDSTTFVSNDNSAFSSGFAGSGYNIRQVSSAWRLDIDDIFVRGSLFANEFIINQILALNGSDIVSPGRGKVESVSGSAPDETATVSDPQGNSLASFVADDLVLIQQSQADAFDGGGTLVKRIVREVASVTSNDVTLQTHSGAPADTGSIEEGDILVAIGNTSDASRQSVIYRSVIDSGAPFTQVKDGIASWSDWTSADTNIMRYGNMNGSHSYATDTPGIGIGDPTADYMTVDATNGIRFLDGADSDKVLGQFSSRAFSFGDVTESEDFIKFDNSTGTVAVTMSLSALEADATEVYISSSNKRVAVGADGSAVTVANATAGTVMEDTGFKSYLDGSNYIRRDGSNLDIATEVFDLSSDGLGITNSDGILLNEGSNLVGPDGGTYQGNGIYWRNAGTSNIGFESFIDVNTDLRLALTGTNEGGFGGDFIFDASGIDEIDLPSTLNNNTAFAGNVTMQGDATFNNAPTVEFSAQNGDNFLVLDNQANTESATHGTFIQFLPTTVSDRQAVFGTESDGTFGRDPEFVFKIEGDGGGLSELMRLDHDGQLGIGTDSPASKLDVSGNINTNGSITADDRITAEDGFKSGTVTIDDDDVAIVASLNSGSSDTSGIWVFNVTRADFMHMYPDGPTIDKITNTSTIETDTGAPIGSSGNDGVTTVFLTSGGNVYINNREGSQLTYKYLIID